MNLEKSLQLWVVEVVDFAVLENKPSESILGVYMGVDENCGSIVKNVSDAAVFATICDEDTDDDFVVADSQKKRKKVTQ